ncbi:hypothetical protein T069G_04164 [Trichoderma breve]|uniref:Uncharacterized protein n=1 Tax=Trichoderma breve TaxID=2034170 RepID=A0A9W9EAN8_9HYPO|nr:hypothetical protein T069G_04164 [Trichoderma breve]KAJ4863210.1 hypothetical protein T069G_04164 [Trichoderma breve]
MRLGQFLATRSLENAATPTPTKEFLQQTSHPVLKPAARTAVERDFSYPPIECTTTTSTQTTQLPSQTNSSQTNSTQTSNGMDEGTKIGLGAGITLGVLALIVVIGLLLYNFASREPKQEADEDADTWSCVVEPSTPHGPKPDFPTQEMYQTGGHRYAPLPNSRSNNNNSSSSRNSTYSDIPIMPAVPAMTGGHRYAPLPNNRNRNRNSTYSDISIMPAIPERAPVVPDQWERPAVPQSAPDAVDQWGRPAVPQRAPVVLDLWGRADDSSQPLMSIAELEDGYILSRTPRMSELNPAPSTYGNSVYSRPAELPNNNNNHTGNQKSAHKIPRKQVGSQATLPRSKTYWYI